MMNFKKKYVFKILDDSELGQAIVEFALVLPILVVLLFGIIEFGRLLSTVSAVTSAAREGARVAAVTSPTLQLVQTAVNNVLNAAGVAGATVTVNGPNASNEVICTVQVNYAPLTGGLFPFLNNNFQITRVAVMWWEG